MTTAATSPRDDAQAVFRTALRAVAPADLVVRCVERLAAAGEPLDAGAGRIAVVGAGKAGDGMARGLERALGAGSAREGRLVGLVAVPAARASSDAAGGGCVELVSARAGSANEPEAAGAAAAERVLALTASLEPEDTLVGLFSGGGSALLPAPVPGLTLDGLREVTRALMAAGADITELNAVRRRLSRIKGGGLARVTRAGRIVVFLLSDVVGGGIADIASGPFAADPTSAAQARRVLAKYGVAGTLPGAVRERLRADAEAAADGNAGTETGGSAVGRALEDSRVRHLVVGDSATARLAAAAAAAARGYRCVDLGSKREPDGEVVARELAAAVARVPRGDRAAIVSGGETTVRLGANSGKGGRNQELALRLVRALPPVQRARTALVVAGTDGEDGPTDAAGALVDPASAACLAGDPARLDAAIERHAAYPLLDAAGALLRTGATGTNVADLRIVLVSG